MKKTTETKDERRRRIYEELGEDMIRKLEKAFTALAAAMLRRAQRKAEAQLRDQQQ